MANERQRLIKRLDNVFSKYIRLRDKRCVICGTTENLQAGHLITRRCYATRWDEMNVFAQCRNCNYTHEYRPEIFTNWYIEKFGADKYQELVVKSKMVVKYKNADLLAMIEYYKQKIKELEANNG